MSTFSLKQLKSIHHGAGASLGLPPQEKRACGKT